VPRSRSYPTRAFGSWFGSGAPRWVAYKRPGSKSRPREHHLIP